jgi:hypothetical protein
MKLITTLLIASAFAANANWFKELFESETDSLYRKAADEIIERKAEREHAKTLNRLKAQKAADEIKERQRAAEEYTRFHAELDAGIQKAKEAREKEEQSRQEMQRIYWNSPEGREERRQKRMADDIADIKFQLLTQ